MPQAGLAPSDDLESLLELFAQAPFSSHPAPIENARQIWSCTLAQDGLFGFVSGEDCRIVGTCMLITAPNLLREGLEHGFIENVATHPDYQRQGHGTAIIQSALERAWIEGCFHVMLQSGRKGPGAHRFYERSGFVGGLRVAYVGRRPAGGQPMSFLVKRRQVSPEIGRLRDRFLSLAFNAPVISRRLPGRCSNWQTEGRQRTAGRAPLARQYRVASVHPPMKLLFALGVPHTPGRVHRSLSIHAHRNSPRRTVNAWARSGKRHPRCTRHPVQPTAPIVVQ